jgi:hypothetical protein
MVAAGGGGGGGDNGNNGGPGTGGGTGDGSGGRENASNMGSNNQTGGLGVAHNWTNNFVKDTLNTISGSMNVQVSFQNLADKKMDVRIVASGPAGTLTEDRIGVTSTNFSLNYTGNYSTMTVQYKWNTDGPSGGGVTHNLTSSWNGAATGGRLAGNGLSGSGGGGAGAVSLGLGGNGGQGGDNSGTFLTEASGSGNLAGDRYFSTAYSRYFGDGGSNSDGNNGGARIVKIA